MEVHLIQCDSMIQEHAVIRSEEEFLDYMEHVTVKGLGGTDFRPVFDLVDRLIREKGAERPGWTSVLHRRGRGISFQAAVL